MKLLLDENRSPRLVELLVDLYPGSEHVNNLGLGSIGDLGVWGHAKEHGFYDYIEGFRLCGPECIGGFSAQGDLNQAGELHDLVGGDAASR